MAKRRKVYSAEERQGLVRKIADLTRSGATIADASKEVGINVSRYYAWSKKPSRRGPKGKRNAAAAGLIALGATPHPTDRNAVLTGHLATPAAAEKVPVVLTYMTLGEIASLLRG